MFLLYLPPCGEERYSLVLRGRYRPGSEENMVVVGMHNRNSPENTAQRVRVTDVIVMPKYGRLGREMSNDVMLLKLERPLTFNDAVSPVCLPSQFKSIASGRRCFSTGWGALRGELTRIHS